MKRNPLPYFALVLVLSLFFGGGVVILFAHVVTSQQVALQAGY